MVSVDNNGNSKEFFDNCKLKGGVKKQELAKKFHLLFDMLDVDGNKILDSNEVNNLTSIMDFQRKDNSTKGCLIAMEHYTTSYTDGKDNYIKEYITDFIQSLSAASQEIIDSKTTVNSDGTKTIVTLFNNNSMETVMYYPDGEIKMKRVDKKVTQKTYTIGSTTYTESEFNKLLNNPETSGILASAIPGESTSISTKIEFSERGKQELKEFTGTHFKDSIDEQYNLMQKFDYTSGDLDKVGVFLSDSAQELYSELSGGEYNTYAELCHIVNANKKNADSLAFTTQIDPNSPWAKTHPDISTDFEKVYQDTTGQKYDILKAYEFQRTAVKYQTVTALKQRTEYLNESIKKIDKLYHEDQLRRQGITVRDREESYDEVLMDTLTNYFGSEEMAAVFLGGVSKGIESINDVTPDKMKEILEEIKRMTEQRYQSELGDEKYENLHSRYLKEYQEFYGVENLKDDIESSISSGQMTGEMLKMGVVITTSIMLGGSTLLQQGGKALAAKLGPQAAKEAIRLGMSFGSIGESYGIDLLNAMSSKEGLTEEKQDLLKEKQAASLPYVLFGAYVSGPIGDSVRNFFKSNPSASSNMLNALFAKMSSSAGFTSEVTADALLEFTLQGGNLSSVFGSNAQGEAFGRFMNMLIGGRANKAALNALQDVKIQQNKLPDGTIEYTTINKDGIEFKTKNPDEIVLGLLGVAAQKSTEGRNIKQMPDGTMIEVNQDGSSTVLQEGGAGVNSKVETPHTAAETPKAGKSQSDGDVNVESFAGFTADLNSNKVSYETYTDNDGNKIIKIVSSAERKSSASGVDFRYSVLKYGQDGKLLDAAENVTDKDIFEKFGKLKDRQIVDNSDGSNAENLYAGVPVPLLKRISNVIGFGKLKNSLKIETYIKNKLSLKNATPEAKQEVKYFLNQILEKNPDINLKENNDLYNFSKIILDIKKRNPNFNTNELSNAVAKLFNTCSDGKYTLKNLYHILSDFVYDRNTNIETGVELFKSLSDNGLNKTQIESLFRINDDPRSSIGLLDIFQDWDSLINIIPYLKDTKETNLFYILDIIKCAKNKEVIKSNTSSYNKSILNSLENLPNDLKKHFIEKGIYVDKLEENLSSITTMKGHEISVDKESQNRFLKSIIANNNLNAENIIKSDNFYNYLQEHSVSGLQLKYSRNTFIKDINDLLSNLSESERNKALKDLGITLKDNDFNGFAHYNKLNTENYDINSKDIVAKIKDCAERFALKNELECDNPEIKSILDDLIQGFPEFTSIIGKQNGRSQNTLDIHILEVLHNAEKNPDYSNLSDNQKTILKFSILMHDLAKQVNESNMEDIATKSGILSSSILDKFNLSQDTKERIVNMVAHHYIYQTETLKRNKYIQLREDLDIAKIITQADIKSESGQEISTKYFDPGKGGANYLPITRCHVKYENYQKHQRNINGKIYEYRLESLDEIPAGADMSKYGFIGIKKEDVVIQTHSVRDVAFLKNVITNYDDPAYYMAISTSVRKLTNSDNGYGKYTLVLSTSRMNRGGGDLYWKRNGYGKDINDFNSSDWPRLGIKSITGISQEVADYVASLEYPTLIKDTEINGKLYTKEELTDIWKKITNDITSTSLNEVLAANPKTQQIIVHDCKSEDELPDELIMIASKYKIPIFIEKK